MVDHRNLFDLDVLAEIFWYGLTAVGLMLGVLAVLVGVNAAIEFGEKNPSRVQSIARTTYVILVSWVVGWAAVMLIYIIYASK